MLKIITNLTDEEIARMKYVRRLYWHWKGSRKMDANKETISTQELADRGIAWPQETFIEYEKRPPHDKYLWAIRSINPYKLMWESLAREAIANLFILAII